MSGGRAPKSPGAVVLCSSGIRFLRKEADGNPSTETTNSTPQDGFPSLYAKCTYPVPAAYPGSLLPPPVDQLSSEGEEKCSPIRFILSLFSLRVTPAPFSVSLDHERWPLCFLVLDLRYLACFALPSHLWLALSPLLPYCFLMNVRT